MKLEELSKISNPKEVYRKFKEMATMNIRIYMYQQEKIRNI